VSRRPVKMRLSRAEQQFAEHILASDSTRPVPPRLWPDYVPDVQGSQGMWSFAYSSATTVRSDGATVPNVVDGVEMIRKAGADDYRSYPFDESRGVSPAMGSGFCAQCAPDPGDGLDGVEFLRAVRSSEGDCVGGIRLLRAVRSGEGGSRRSCLVAARPRAAGRDDRFDGVEVLRADTHRGWGIASMARAAARWARFS
jgi:hypothetical protein